VNINQDTGGAISGMVEYVIRIWKNNLFVSHMESDVEGHGILITDQGRLLKKEQIVGDNQFSAESKQTNQ
jgi:hypothetical protein